MKNIGNYVFWILFCAGVFSVVYLAMYFVGAALLFSEWKALGITFGFTAVILALNAKKKTKDSIKRFFGFKN